LHWISLVAALLAVSGAELGFPAESLELNLQVSRDSDRVFVVASARNASENPVRFCGHWVFRLDYVPNPESEIKLTELKAKRELERLETEARGEAYYGECGPHLSFFVGDLTGSVPGQNWISLVPGEAYRASFEFDFDPKRFENWPGKVRIRYNLNLCEDLMSHEALIPSNHLGGSLVAELPAP